MKTLEIREKHIKIKGCFFKITNIQITKYGLNTMIDFSMWNLSGILNEPLLEIPPITITIDMVKKAIFKMKFGKAAGPSGVVGEMIRAAGDTGATIIRDLAIAII